jgi:hypothetical protein
MLEYILLGVALAVFLISWYTPIPYGRFSASEGVLNQFIGIPNIPNRWFIGLANIPTIIFLIIHLPDVSNFGLVVFVFLLVHFVFRAILVPVITGFIYHADEKECSVLILIMFMAYNGLAGYTLGYMCTNLNGSFFMWLDLPLLIGASCALLMNVYYDIRVNWMRCHDGNAKIQSLYVTYKSLETEFPLLFWLNITSPNYFFEVIEWGFVVILTWHTESLCYFVATWLILWVRALSINRWLEIKQVEHDKKSLSAPQ